MTFIIFGVGAIGGAIAGKLAASSQPVAGIARGAQLEALRTDGLLLRTPEGDSRTTFPVVADPGELELAPDDVIFLTMKSQDTQGALEALAAAGVTSQPIVCAQNGVSNEREALRFFPNVYAMMVVMPATFVRPGEVVAFGGPKAGIFDIGRYPSGNDATAERICAALETAGFAAFPTADAMQSKYGKLIMNLGNVLDAAAGEASYQSDLAETARAEARTVLKAAGIALSAAGGADDERRKQLMQMQPVPGAERVGSSSAQSLARGTGSIETEYLNGEISLLGRVHGVPTPVNDGLVRLGRYLIAEKSKPGSLKLDEVTRIVRS